MHVEETPMADKKSPSLDETLEQVLAQVHAPLPVDELATRILAFIYG